MDRNLLTSSWIILGWIFERQNLAINGCVLKIRNASAPEKKYTYIYIVLAFDRKSDANGNRS